MTCSFPGAHLIAALHSILQELEADSEAQAHHPELHNLKLQIIATLNEVELHHQAAAEPLPPPPKAGIAILAELLREGSPAFAAQPDALPPLRTEDAA